MVSEHRLDTFTGISIAMIISGQQDNKERRKPIFCIRWIAKRMQACYNRRRTMNRPPFVLWTMRCSSYRSARKQNHRAPLSTDETLSPGETGAWVDPIARLSCSVFIARRAFDPASVCYAPRVAHGDRAAYLSARGDATLLVLSVASFEREKLDRDNSRIYIALWTAEGKCNKTDKNWKFNSAEGNDIRNAHKEKVRWYRELEHTV